MRIGEEGRDIRESRSKAEGDANEMKSMRDLPAVRTVFRKLIIIPLSPDACNRTLVRSSGLYSHSHMTSSSVCYPRNIEHTE